MQNTTTVVVGAGHCGLAVSRHLADRSIDHVVLERGEVANSWRTQRWDSLRLLTPNWMTRLPGYAYRGDDPDGYQTAQQVARLIEDYATEWAAPVLINTTVTSIRPASRGYQVRTDQGTWHADTVVLASGACAIANVPQRLAPQVPAGITTVATADYRNPDQVPDGGVLVVGASASGIQIAQELHVSGRPVTLAVGEHVRMPRTYRGKDILWWMDASGLLDERYDEVPDLMRARNLPSMQLVGSPDRATVDLNSLRRLGVRLVGRLAGIRDETAQFSGSLPNVCALADLKLGRLLDTIDGWAAGAEPDGDRPHQWFAPTDVPAPAPLSVDLRTGEIRTIVWATGFRPELSWLDVPVLDRKGQVIHDGGVTAAPGLYLIGMPFLRRRKSSLIDGAAADASDLTSHLAGYLDRLVAGPVDRPAPRADRWPTGRQVDGIVVQQHPLACSIAAAVACRDGGRLAAALTSTVRLRALLPGGPIESHGRENVVARFGGWFADFDTVELVESAGETVADRLLIHYRLSLGQGLTRWVCTQTAVCKVNGGRLAVIDLLCSGFRKIGETEDDNAQSRSRLVG